MTDADGTGPPAPAEAERRAGLAEVAAEGDLAAEADRGPEAVGVSTSGQLLRSSAVVAVGTALSRVTGLIRTIAQLAALGSFVVGDAFYVANTAPNLLYDLLLGGVLAATLIPVFVANQQRGDDDGTAAVLTVLGSALVALTAVAMLASPVLARVFASDPAERSLLTLLLVLLLPQILFYGLSTLGSGLLNSHRRFAAAAFAPVANNVVAIAILVWFARAVGGAPTVEGLQDQTGLVIVLGLGTTAGIAVQALVLWPAVRRAGIRWRWRFDLRNPSVRTVLRLSGWTVGYVVANQITLWLVTILASRLADGDVVAYNSAYQFFQLPYGLLAVSVITAFMPDLASLAGRGDRRGFSDRFLLALRLVLLLVVPCAVLLIILGRPIVSALLEHGNVTASGADAIARSLIAFSVGLPSFCVYLLAMRGFYAHQDTRRPFWINLGENGVNIVLAVALVGAFGAAGLSLSFALAYVIAAVGALWMLHRRCGGLDWAGQGASLARIVVAAAAMAVAVVAVRVFVGSDTGPGAWVQMLAGIGVGSAVYLAACQLLRVPELRQLTALRRRGG